MEQIRKRLLSGLLALVMAVSLLPLQTFALDVSETGVGAAEAETSPEHSGETPVSTGVSDTPEDIEYQEYTVYYTHQLRYTVDGKGYHAEEGPYPLTVSTVELAAGYDMAQLAYEEEPLSVSAPVLTLENIEEYAAYGATITYTVKSGWTVVRKDSGEADGVTLRTAFQGQIDDYEFVPADVVRFTLNYMYSPTGGMSGASAVNSAVIEVLLSELVPDDTGTSVAIKDRDIPVIENMTDANNNVIYFRIVLDPEPLNDFLVNPLLARKAMNGELSDEEIQAALDNGDFNVKIDERDQAHPVYWVQDPSYDNSAGNSKYQGNRYSNAYNQAWDEARVNEGDYFTAKATGTLAQGAGQGANSLEKPKLTITLTEKQLNAVKALLKTVKDAEKAVKAAETEAYNAGGTDETLNDKLKAAKEDLDTAQKDLDAALTLTIYYRRNASFYTVEHLVPVNLAGNDYEDAVDEDGNVLEDADGNAYKVVFTQYVQGRAGALTNAKDSPEVGTASGAVKDIDVLKKDPNNFDFSTVVPTEVSQVVIGQRNTDGTPTTVVRITYQAAQTYRVIFNTNYAYIPRQEINLGDTIVFDNTDVKPSLTIKGDAVDEYVNPSRPGYTFVGWGYQLKDQTTTRSDTNQYFQDEDGIWYRVLPTVSGNSQTYNENHAEFTLNDIIGGLATNMPYITNSETGEVGTKALYLHPRWKADNANVRVVLWVEDLDQAGEGENDVKVEFTGSGNTTYNPDDKYKDNIQTNEAWSNMGSFNIRVSTGAALDLKVQNNVLSSSISIDNDGNQVTSGGTNLADKINAEFKTAMSTVTGYDGKNIDAVNFYQPYRADTGIDDNGAYVQAVNSTVDADGTTVLNVRYIRKSYAVEFVYYGQRGNNWYIASNTDGYSLGTPTGFDYNTQVNVNNSTYQNQWQQINQNNIGTPEKVRITAKYGADLSNVWPVATGETATSNQKTYYFISWATTTGPYNEYYKAEMKAGRRAEGTIMGVYSAMSENIIADPANPATVHTMYAYWYTSVSEYRNNHCYELTGLTANDVKTGNGVQQVSLHQGSMEDKNSLYLIPVNSTVLNSTYNFGDLMRVNYTNNRVVYEDEDGFDASAPCYYAVRIFSNKCYAVAARVETVSSNIIAAQNPSARLHLTKVENTVTVGGVTYNYAPDHSAAHADSDGDVTKQNGTITGDYDLYFYYDREPFYIIYTVPVTNNTEVPAENGTDRELARVKVPYGTVLEEAAYATKLDDQGGSSKVTDKNSKYWDKNKNNIDWDNDVTVCPDRAADGTAVWEFSGWFTNRALTVNPSWGTTVTGNVRLYAGWNIPTYTVTFNFDGGEVSGLSDEELANLKSQTIRANQSFTSANGQIPRPLKNGYVLKGWVLEGTTTLFSFDTPITSDKSVIADWEEDTSTKAYYYKVYHLTEDDPENGKGTYNGTPLDNEGKPVDATAWYILGVDETYATADNPYFAPEGSTLWLAAKAFDGYVPKHPNHDYVLSDESKFGAGTLENPMTYFFYYTKTQTKEYTLKFVLAGTENADRTGGEEISEAEFTGSADVSVLQPGSVALSTLNAKGYQLVKREGDNAPYAYTAVGTSDELEPLRYTDIEAVYLVQPITYTVTYETKNFDNDGQQLTSGAVYDALKAATQAKVDALTESDKYPYGTASVNSGLAITDAEATKNPGKYLVTSPGFKINNPDTYVQIEVDGETQWWKFAGWSVGTATFGTIDDPTDVTVDKGSVGKLTFLANWKRITEPQLKIEKTVTSSVTGVTPPEVEFSFEATLPASATGNYADVLYYKTNADGTVTPDTLSSSPVSFTLKAGESVSFDGLAAGSVSVTETTSGTSNNVNYGTLFDNTQTNYWTVDDAAKNGTVQTNGSATITFTNTYHATVTLDLDPDTDGNQGFPIVKYMKDKDGNTINFFGGTYTFRVRRGNNSPANTPLPNLGADGQGSVSETSTSSTNVLNASFDSVRFVETGTYYYVFREERPTGEGVPGVTYDNTRYRVTIVVAADGENLTARITNVQKLPSNAADDGPDAGWETVTEFDPDTGLAGLLVFNNTYNETEVSRTFVPTKRLVGRDDTPMAAGEFTFTLTPVGSHAMTETEAKNYHTANETGRLALLAAFSDTDWTEDSDQPMPSNVGADGKVGNGMTGTIRLDSITYDADDMGGELYGKVYKYTLAEDVPAGAVNNKYQGITYDAATRTLYVYVHLHDANTKTLAKLGDSDTLVYADVLGDRNAIFENVYSADPVTVELGKPENSQNSALSITKEITGRSFQANDSFSFTLTAKDGAPMPLDAADNGDGVFSKTVIITPASGNSADVAFGTVTFTTAGTYVYELQEVVPDPAAANMTYDTDVKTLTVTVTDVNGTLKAAADPIKWTNQYVAPYTPPPYNPGPSTSSNIPKLDTSDHYAYIVGRSDGLVHPNDYITRAEAATIFYRLLTEDSRKALWTKENTFPDVNIDDWYNVAVSVISNGGVIQGRSNGMFDPGANITRGEFATIAARFLSTPYVGGDYYADISNHWAREYINRAAAAGWIKDFDKPFRPDDYMTRAEVMALVNAMIGRTPDKDHMHKDMIQWPDNMDTTMWYYADVQEATNSHEYNRISNKIENWTKILPVRDWNAIEKAWSDIYSSMNPGEVVGN